MVGFFSVLLVVRVVWLNSMWLRLLKCVVLVFWLSLLINGWLGLNLNMGLLFGIFWLLVFRIWCICRFRFCLLMVRIVGELVRWCEMCMLVMFLLSVVLSCLIRVCLFLVVFFWVCLFFVDFNVLRLRLLCVMLMNDLLLKLVR